MLPTLDEVRSRIDHAILTPELMRSQVDVALDVAVEHEVFSVCVRPSDVAYAVARLGGRVATGTVIAFPHGTTSTAAKVAETTHAVADGAVEIDMVLNIGWLRSELLRDAQADIAAVVEASHGHPVKVILETSFLTDSQIVSACRISEAAGAAFVKTSTGFAGAGATVEDVALMRSSVSEKVEVKASGGIRDLDTLLAMADAGATRFGTSATTQILDELAARLG